MSNNETPDASRPHEVTLTLWLPEDADPRRVLSDLVNMAEDEYDAAVVASDWEDV